jgi:hypothetical protein
VRVPNQFGDAAFPPATGLERGNKFRSEPHPDQPRRDTRDDNVGGDIAGRHCPGADHRAIVDLSAAAEDRHPVADPDIAADFQGIFCDGLDVVAQAGCHRKRMRNRPVHRMMIATPNDQLGTNRTIGPDPDALRQRAKRQDCAIV